MELDIANDYMEHHEDLYSAASAFAKSLVGGDPTRPRGYPLESAILATVDAFGMTPREAILLTTRLAVEATSRD